MQHFQGVTHPTLATPADKDVTVNDSAKAPRAGTEGGVNGNAADMEDQAADVNRQRDGGTSAKRLSSTGAAKSRRDGGSPRRRSRSGRSLSSARAGAEMTTPLGQSQLPDEHEAAGRSSAAAAPASGGSVAQTSATAASVAHGSDGGGKEEKRREGSRSAHPLESKPRIKRAASGNLMIKIAAGSATVGIVRVCVAVVAALLRGKAQEREVHSKNVAIVRDRYVGSERDDDSSKGSPARLGKGKATSAAEAPVAV